MKHILLLLIFNSICLAQETKVTAYRLINESADGPCSVKYYIEEDDTDNFFSYVTAHSTDTIMMSRLLKINIQAKKKKGMDFWCELGTIGGDMIHNMMIIEMNNKRDTIFLTRNNEHIVFPEEGKAFVDKYHIINGVLSGNIKEFFEYDFQKDLSAMFMGKRDSINANAVLYRDKNIKSYSKEKFENEFGKLKFQKSEENAYNKNMIIYTFEGNIYTFENDEKLVEIEVLNPNSGWAINGLQIGSRQESFEDKYPESMSFNVICSEKFEDYKSEQLHWLLFKEDKGSVSFWIKDGVLDRFIVDYY